jgi:antitoxin VapB
MQTRAFKHGDTQAVGISAEIAHDGTDIALEIAWLGDRIIIETIAQSPGELIRQMKVLPDFMAKGRRKDEQEERSAL